ncbi:hypothetical protein CTI12_AA259330 [Artemisia annua]|uniref:Uncharacterized protein n=1 Tax=Artemisia annua TaxID=35608 RepID=A0A2U1NIX1_ARTAN|nr:hypothetical protein CTI12_AA259330 [Artemisia annua]
MAEATRRRSGEAEMMAEAARRRSSEACMMVGGGDGGRRSGGRPVNLDGGCDRSLVDLKVEYWRMFLWSYFWACYCVSNNVQ